MDDLEKAILDFRTAVEVEPLNVRNRLDATEALLEVGKYEEVLVGKNTYGTWTAYFK